MEKELKKSISFVKKHKFVVLGVLLILIVAGGIFLSLGRMFMKNMSYGGSSYDNGIYPEYTPLPRSSYKSLGTSSYERQIDEQASEILSKPTEYQIKKGSVDIKSKDSVSEYETLCQKTQSLGGWVETMKKHDDYTQITVTAQLKVPFEKFDEFAEWMVDSLDVKDANLELYKVTVKMQQDEMQILLEALDVYDRLLVRAEKMNVTAENIEIIMKITQKRLEVMGMLRDYGYSIEQTEKQSNYATITVSLKQDKKIKVMPEDLGKELRIKIRNSIKTITNMAMDLITIPLVVLVKTLTWILYVIIVVVPVFIAYRILRRVFKGIGKKI